MATRFVHATKEDFVNHVTPEAKGWVATVTGNEVVMVRKFKRTALKVYTSVRVGTTVSRKKGIDAIRVCACEILADGSEGRGLVKLPHVKRTTGWQERVRKHLMNVWTEKVAYREK